MSCLEFFIAIAMLSCSVLTCVLLMGHYYLPVKGVYIQYVTNLFITDYSGADEL